jgi:mono/diheme cytochrome c family protein
LVKYTLAEVKPELTTEDASTPRAWPWLVIVGAIAVIAASIFAFAQTQATADPYVRQVFSHTGNPEKGGVIFQVNCAGCHGWSGEGNVGPQLWGISKRRSQSYIIHQVISGRTPPMPKFQPSPEAMADLLSYLEKI